MLEPSINYSKLTNAEVSWVTNGAAGNVQLNEVTAPSGTATGRGLLYVLSSDSKLYYQNDSGAVTDLTTGGGITSINGLTNSTQTFATATVGNDFNIVSSGSQHTFNLPNATSNVRGVVSTGVQTFGGEKTFLNDVKIDGATGLQFTGGGGFYLAADQGGAAYFYTADGGVGAPRFQIHNNVGTTTITFSSDQDANLNFGALSASRNYDMPNMDGTVVVAGVLGALGTVLTSTGTGTVPTWQAPTGGTGGTTEIHRWIDAVDFALPDVNFAGRAKYGTTWVNTVLDFDPTTDEQAYYKLQIPRGTSVGSTYVELHWIAATGYASATSSTTVWNVVTRSITSGESFDASTTPAQATASVTSLITGNNNLAIGTVWISNATTWVNADLLEMMISRNASNAADNLTSDARFLGAMLRIKSGSGN